MLDGGCRIRKKVKVFFSLDVNDSTEFRFELLKEKIIV